MRTSRNVFPRLLVLVMMLNALMLSVCQVVYCHGFLNYDTYMGQKTVFTHSDITLPKVNRFGWNL